LEYFGFSSQKINLYRFAVASDAINHYNQYFFVVDGPGDIQYGLHTVFHAYYVYPPVRFAFGFEFFYAFINRLVSDDIQSDIKSLKNFEALRPVAVMGENQNTNLSAHTAML
jgi:hypothetical protein